MFRCPFPLMDHRILGGTGTFSGRVRVEDCRRTTGFARTRGLPVRSADTPMHRVHSLPPLRGLTFGRTNPRRRWTRPGVLLASLLSVGMLAGCDRGPAAPAARLPELVPGLGYTNQRVAAGPWSIHVLEMDRSHPSLALGSVHAGGGALGLSPLSEQLRQIPAAVGIPVGAVNGDFYQRDRPHAGDPRGLQILNGELISAPNGSVAFWIDAQNQPQAGSVASRFQITLPDGSLLPVELNRERSAAHPAVLYTPSAGPTTRTPAGQEIVLEPQGASALRPLAIGTTNVARVRKILSLGDAPIERGTWVLSLDPALARSHPAPEPGVLITLSLATEPDLLGTRTAIGGGPLLVHQGRPERIAPPSQDSYEFSSMSEPHPRTALGWNERSFFLVQVDGRQPGLSEGMTLEELAKTMIRLGCTEAMNLDGGGSSTLWADGTVRNSPCDGQERPIANGLVVLRIPSKVETR